jgi:hypothetical protein
MNQAGTLRPPRGYLRAALGSFAGVVSVGVAAAFLVEPTIAGAAPAQILSFDHAGQLELEALIIYVVVALAVLLGAPLACWLFLRSGRCRLAGITALWLAPVLSALVFAVLRVVPSAPHDPVVEPYAVAVGAFASDAEVHDGVIDKGLELVRRLWDAGLAHRDIKPANLLVRDGEVYLIDAFFVQVRPSPWRQAVDLGNMLLVLAVRTNVERVYRHALRYFTPEEIAEAIAATRGVASPTQLRAFLKRDGRDLLSGFRALVPPRAPISIQRWSLRRVGLALSVVFISLFAAWQTIVLFLPTHDLPIDRPPECGSGSTMVLMAQSVPSATRLPCVKALPAGWHFGGLHVRRGRSTMWLNSEEGGQRGIEVALGPRSSCDVSGATSVHSDEVGVTRFEGSPTPGLGSTRTYLFPGGCITYRSALARGTSPSLLLQADEAISLEPREEIVAAVRKAVGLDLCGARVPCPGGADS